jgi:hypothetical protein
MVGKLSSRFDLKDQVISLTDLYSVEWSFLPLNFYLFMAKSLLGIDLLDVKVAKERQVGRG